jgi:hypothetical protein
MFITRSCASLLPEYSGFMFGSFDLDDVSYESDVTLGEAILDAHTDDQAIAAVPHVHHRVGTAAGVNDAFMFGVNAEQPVIAAWDEPIMDLCATELT